MHRLLPLLFLACASSKPTEYERGTYRPAPPAFNPSQDAPHTVGQPGHLQPPQDYPRSPHSRPLQSTPEPGLWAGDDPQASKGAVPKPVLFGVALPGIPLSEGQVDYGPAQVCAATWALALPGTGLDEKVRALRAPAKRCLVARMFHFCARVVDELDGITTRDGVVVFQSRRVKEKFRRGAEDFFRESCDGGRWTDELRRLMDVLAAAHIDFIHRTD